MKFLHLPTLTLALASCWYGAGLKAAPISFLNTFNGVWSTGLDVSGGLLANGVDPHYALLALPVGCSAANTNCQEGPGDAFGPNAYVVTGSDPVGTLWAAHSAGSKWIGPRADQSTGEIYGNDTDFYLYRTVFDISALALDPAFASISLTWWADNANTPAVGTSSHIRLCAVTSIGDPVCSPASVVAGSNSGGAAGAGTNVTINSGFTAGLMALDFIVFNRAVTEPGANNPSGLQVHITSAFVDTERNNGGGEVPEPSSFALAGLGLAAFGARLRSRRVR